MMKFAETTEQRSLIKAINGGISISKFNTDDDKGLYNFLGEWKIMIGDPRKTEGKGAAINLVMISMKIKELYPTITLPEIKKAVDLSMLGVLNITAELYNNQSFSVLYCIGILKAYLEWKREQLIPIIERWQKAAPEEKKLSEKQLMIADCQAIKELFEEEYALWLSKNEINDPFDQLYNYLKRNKRLVISKEEIEKARVYAREKVADFLKKEDGSVSEAIEKMRTNTNKGDILNITDLEKKFARKYCVYHLFKNIVNIKEFTKTIKPSEFKIFSE